MNVNFDGMRRNATSSMNSLQHTIQKIIERNNLDEDERDKLIDSFNVSAMYVDSFNCLEDDTVKDDLNCLDDLSITRLQAVKECPQCGYTKDIDDFASDDMCNECYEDS